MSPTKTTTGTAKPGGMLDPNGHQVHSFALEVANVGYRRLADLITSMLDSGVWQDFTDGLGRYMFLPGEFDYFLTQQGVTRDDVMNGIRDIEVKARLEESMDERRTGEDGYRRRFAEARDSNPQRPGQPIFPFGCTSTEAKALLSEGASTRSTATAALGASVRRFRNSGGATSKAPSAQLPPAERARRLAIRLDDDALAELIDQLKEEQRIRKRRSKQDPIF